MDKSKNPTPNGITQIGNNSFNGINLIVYGVDPQVVENLIHQLAEARAENKRLLGIVEKLTKKQ